MLRIGIVFELQHAETKPGETVRVVGDCMELGDWDPYDPCHGEMLELRTGPSLYPRWALSTPVWLQLPDGKDCKELHRDYEDMQPDDMSIPETPRIPHAPENDCACYSFGDHSSVYIEYKFVRDRRRLEEHGPSVQWEDSIVNRRVMLPREPGTIWIVSDVGFNAGGLPRVSRTSLDELMQRIGDMDPEWTMRHSMIPRVRSPSPEWGGRHYEEDLVSSPRSQSGHTTSTILLF